MVTPKLRFKGFDESWKISYFEKAEINIIDGDRGTNYPKSNDFYDQGFCLFLNAGNVTKSGFRFENTQFIDEKKDGLLRKGKLKREDIIITTRGTVGNIAYFDDSVIYENIRINSGMVIVRSNKSTIPAYLNQFLTSNIFEKWTEKNVFGSAQPQLTVKLLKSIPISLPSLEEQTKIASFLSVVDDKITQLTQEHELLSEYKKGMMQQLFSQKLRFKKDDGGDFKDWEERKLSEVGENIIGLTYSPKDVTNDGSGILVLRSSNIKNGRLDKRDQVRVNKVIKDRIIIQQNDILICARNGSQRLIGKSVLINDTERMTFGAFMSVYRSQYNHFISYLMQSSWFFEQVQMNLGARINQITTGTLNEFTFDFPTMEEQTKIANFLSTIDQKIDNVAAQIDQAQVWKKGLSQQMFV